MALEIMYGIGTLVLLVAIAWGIHQTRTRNKANDPITNRATRDLYQHPETYDHDRDLRGDAAQTAVGRPHDPNVTEARQGETSNHMRWVLLVSCVLAVVLIGGAVYFTR